jgi:hypothetical protein
MKRYSYVTGCDCGFIEDSAGDYVKYADYEALSKYADSLVEFSKIPCLPKDLEILREANGHFAQANHILQSRIRELEAEIRSLNASLKNGETEIVGWKNKWDAAEFWVQSQKIKSTQLNDKSFNNE